MNIFALAHTPYEAAQLHLDVHVSKMILESAQLLSTAKHVAYESFGNTLIGHGFYKKTHGNHPCSIWTRASMKNYEFLHTMMWDLNTIFRMRGRGDHGSMSIWGMLTPCSILKEFVPNIGLTPFATAMPDEYTVPGDPVKSYRRYYALAKAKLARSNRDHAIIEKMKDTLDD